MDLEVIQEVGTKSRKLQSLPTPSLCSSQVSTSVPPIAVVGKTSTQLPGVTEWLHTCHSQALRTRVCLHTSHRPLTAGHAGRSDMQCPLWRYLCAVKTNERAANPPTPRWTKDAPTQFGGNLIRVSSRLIKTEVVQLCVFGCKCGTIGHVAIDCDEQLFLGFFFWTK